MGSVCSSSASSVVSGGGGGRSPVKENNNNIDKIENGAKIERPQRSSTSSLSSVSGTEIPGTVLGCVDPVPCSLLTYLLFQML